MGLRRWWRHLRHLGEDRRWPRVVGLLLAVSAAGALALLLSELGPRSVDREETGQALMESAELEVRRQRVTELVGQFEAAEAMGRITPEALAQLAEAMTLQERVVREARLRRGPEQELWDSLKRRHDEVAAMDLAAETRRLEAEAREQLATGGRAEGVILLRQAVERQDRLNRLYPAAPQTDLGRVMRLQGEIRELQVRPTYERSVELEREGEALMAAAQWEEAEARLLEAARLQGKIIETYRQSIWADFGRVDRLARTLVAIRSGRLHVAVAEKVAEAEAAEEAEQWVRAASLFLEARTLQRNLNEGYRESPFVSTARLDELEGRRQSVLSTETARRIAAEHEALETALRLGQETEAGERAIIIVREMERMKAAHPRSRYVDDELLLKARFLDLLAGDLARVQRSVGSALVPLPEAEGWQILGIEVSQWLFERLMGTNPSRQQGESLPVESVTWGEAQEFCRRLSWVLVRPVRLPSEREWRNALGSLRYAPLESWSWHRGNAGGVLQPVGTREPHATGVRDLLGNVAEWLDTDSSTADAPEAGGSIMDPPEVLIDAPVRRRAKSERSRFTGFRVVAGPS